MQIPTFVKWAGGKKQLLEQFKPLYPKDFNNYYEPFAGSGAVFFYIRGKHAEEDKEYFLSDNNKDLVNLYSDVRDNVDELISLLKGHKKNHHEGEDYYYEIRNAFNKGSKGVERSAQFIYLNKTCFNGLYRVNSKGKFNVPKGRYTNPAIANERVLKEASKLLQGVTINYLPFEKMESLPRKGDFVYLDPPYHPLSQTAKFTSYTKEDFAAKDQERLAEYYGGLDERGCFVMLSNSDMEFIKSLYKGYKINTVKAKRAISCKAEGRGGIKEVVVRNY